ncbi:phosphatidylinositol-binding clathrin assembly protein-like [Sinocyclocheilus grahami]|uniref:phosphatidylinositol-binding clathrin assembly protein-like n=1 Tax=Sinocyclocheilus grahami TaxID=75366 RepID=UPI0007AD1C20|nr:PREDICTED: phosphatidylinositol-binding clathrin assembly protein-like [Sinocyclocheilus grahami]
MSGQSITDRITAAQHSVTGSAVSKTVCKATTHEVMGPKKKHLDYLIHCTNEMNVNIPQLADTLFERTTNTSWVVVFKSLITTHHIMVYGNERFVQYLASRNTLFNLSNFLDKSGLQGRCFQPNTSLFILFFQTHPSCKYFDMKKAQCKEGLDIYKKFLTRMTRISEFLKVAEQVGIDRGDIPDLSQFTVCAPSSLLDALEQHLASLEGKKVKDSTAASRASTLSNAVSSLANTGISFTKVDEREKQAALEEEQARLKALKEQRLKELSKKPSTTAASPVSTATGTISSAPAIDLFSTPSSFNNSTDQNGLLGLQPAFQPSLPLSTGLPLANTWGDPFTSTEAVDDSIPNLNPFLTKPDPVHLPVVSSDAVSFSSRTPSHEMFGDNYNPFIDSSGSVASPVEPSARMGCFLSDSFCSLAAYPNTPLFHSEPSAVAGLFGGFSAPPAGQPPSSTGLNVDFDSVFGNKSAANSTDSAGKTEVNPVAVTHCFSPHTMLHIHLTAEGQCVLGSHSLDHA